MYYVSSRDFGDTILRQVLSLPFHLEHKLPLKALTHVVMLLLLSDVKVWHSHKLSFSLYFIVAVDEINIFLGGFIIRAWKARYHQQSTSPTVQKHYTKTLNKLHTLPQNISRIAIDCFRNETTGISIWINDASLLST